MTGLGLLEMAVRGFMWNLELLLRKREKEDGTQLTKSQNLGSSVLAYEVFFWMCKGIAM